MVVWNTEQELKFLVLILSIKDVKMSTDDWTTVASQMGPEFNWNGCRYEVSLALNLPASNSNYSSLFTIPV